MNPPARGDTLPVRLAVPLIGPAEVSHLLGLRPAGRTKKEPPRCPPEALRVATLFTKPELKLKSQRFLIASSLAASSDVQYQSNLRFWCVNLSLLPVMSVACVGKTVGGSSVGQDNLRICQATWVKR